MQEDTASAPEGRNYEQLLLLFRPFRAVCLLCIYIALTDYAMQFCPFRALRAGCIRMGGSLTENTSKSSNSSGLKNKFLTNLASSALLWKAKAFVVANIAYYAMSSYPRGGALVTY